MRSILNEGDRAEILSRVRFIKPRNSQLPFLRFIVLIALFVAVNEAMATKRMGIAKINGTRIYYEVKGNGSPIVLVSGGGVLDRRGWVRQFDTLAKHFTVIRYDVRGIGKSARPQAAFSHSKDLYSLLQFLGIRRAHIIGLSVGGAIAIDFTLEYPQMVDHLILAASGLSDDAKGAENLQGLSTLARLTEQKGIEQVIQLTLDTPFVITQENAAAREIIREIYLDNRDVFESGFPVYSLWQPTQPPASERLSEIHARTLIIRGDKDSPAYLALTNKIGAGIKGSQMLVIPGGTHFINLDKPEEFNRAVLQFLMPD